MKKYYLQCLKYEYERVYILFDLEKPRLVYGFLEFKLIDHVGDIESWTSTEDGYCDIDEHGSIGDENKLLEFESDEEAKLWFEMNYKV